MKIVFLFFVFLFFTNSNLLNAKVSNNIQSIKTIEMDSKIEADRTPKEKLEFQRNPASSEMGFGCCKICTSGKACGNSCISRSKICHQGRGCACDG